MIRILNYLWQLALVTALLTLLAIFLFPGLLPEPPLDHVLITLYVQAFINLGIYLLATARKSKDERSGTLRVLAAISLKILLYMFFLLLFWVATKNITIPYIITFFALYLIFTFFILYHLLKVLNNK